MNNDIYPATEKFVARDHFVSFNSEELGIEIGSISQNFNKWFLNKIERPKDEPRMVHSNILQVGYTDSQIISELGGKKKLR